MFNLLPGKLSKVNDDRTMTDVTTLGPAPGSTGYMTLSQNVSETVGANGYLVEISLTPESSAADVAMAWAKITYEVASYDQGI